MGIPSVFVHAVLPPGQRHITTCLAGYPEEVLINGVMYHFCPNCDGWIEGESVPKKVNTLNPRLRSGRRGLDYYCRRCDYKLGFVGLRS